MSPGCITGSLTEIVAAGFIPGNSPDVNLCKPLEGTDAAICEPYLRSTELSTFWEGNCQGKRSCSIIGLDRFLDKANAPAVCLSDTNRMFIQAHCKQSSEELESKRVLGLLVSCINGLIGLFFLAAIYYLTRSSKIKLIDYDVSTVTAADYTIEYMIPKHVYNTFLSEHYREGQGTKIEAFKAFLKTELEGIVSNAKGVFNESTDIKIANIFFAFNNAELVTLLRKRGEFIVQANETKEKEIDERISALKDAKRDDFVIPVAAFITFKTQEGYERAIRFKGEKRFCRKKAAEVEFVDRPLIMKPAPEPTNIIWENRSVKKKTRYIRTAGVVVVVFAIMLLVFYVFFIMKRYVIRMNQNYKRVQCDWVE